MTDAPIDNTPETAEPYRPRPKKKPPFKAMLIALLALVVVGFIIVGLFLAAKPAPVQIQGMVEAETFVVSTKVPSRVERFLAEEGQTVAAGTELAVMSSPEVEANFATRAKMGQSSDVYAVAVTTDGKALYAKKEVKVTLGGCGG